MVLCGIVVAFSIHSPIEGYGGSFYLSATSSEAGLHMLLGEWNFPFSEINAKEYN